MRQLHERQSVLKYAVSCFPLVLLLCLPGTAIADNGAPIMKSPDMTATTLLIIGVIMLMLEIKIVSQGMLGFLGGLCLVIATVIIWRDDASFWGVPVVYVIPVIGLVLVLGVWLSVLGAQAYNEPVVSGFEGFVGEEAEASEPLNPAGRVFFQGSYWQAESSVPVKRGAKVRILSASKLKLMVEPLEHEHLHSPHNEQPKGVK